MSGPNDPFAVRCFFREFADMQSRYDHISAQLRRVNLPYTVPFSYLRDGITVKGANYPVLKMDWVGGLQLDQYIRVNLSDQRALAALASSWKEMAIRLSRAGIAHGDLQHGNVLCLDGQLRLVDYDGMFVPALSSRESHELGHPNYQHPTRTSRDFGPWLDHFSEWLIYVSILALSVEPALWDELRAGDERLLFAHSDLVNPSTSGAFKRLTTHSDMRVRSSAAHLLRSLSARPSSIPPLSDTNLGTTTRTRSKSGRKHRIVAEPSVPDWIVPHLVPAPPLSLVDPGAPPRALVAAMAGVMALDLLPVTQSWLSITTRWDVAGVAAGGSILTVVGSYLRGGDVRDGLRLRYQIALCELRVRLYDQLLRRRLEARDRLTVQAGRIQLGVDIAVERVRTRHNGRRDYVQSQLRAHLDRVKNLELSAQQAKSQALDEAFRNFQTRSRTVALRRLHILPANIDGLDLPWKIRLWMSGIEPRQT